MVDLARKAQGTEVEWQLAYVFQDHGYLVEPHQMNRDKSNRDEAAVAMLPEDPYGGENLVMPDLTCWKDGSAVLVEVKSKYETAYGQYGLDRRRFRHLKQYRTITGMLSLYVIYDTAIANGRLDDRNAFFYATVDDLDQSKEDCGKFFFWSTDLFKPLIPYLAGLDQMPVLDDMSSVPIIPPHHGSDSIATLH